VLCLLLAVRRWDPFDAVLCLLLAARWEAQQGHHARCCSWLGAIVGVFRRIHRACQVPATTGELELRYATAGALAGTTNRLYADCNSGFEVRYRSVPTVQSGYTITH